MKYENTTGIKLWTHNYKGDCTFNIISGQGSGNKNKNFIFKKLNSAHFPTSCYTFPSQFKKSLPKHGEKRKEDVIHQKNTVESSTFAFSEVG